MQVTRLEHDMWQEAAGKTCWRCEDGCSEPFGCARLAEQVAEMKEERNERRTKPENPKVP